jgi:hypothetical protein
MGALGYRECDVRLAWGWNFLDGSHDKGFISGVITEFYSAMIRLILGCGLGVAVITKAG